MISQEIDHSNEAILSLGQNVKDSNERILERLDTAIESLEEEGSEQVNYMHVEGTVFSESTLTTSTTSTARIAPGRLHEGGLIGSTSERSKEEQDLFDKAEMLAFINDPEERKNCTSLAMQIREIVGKNWFTFNRFINKSKETKESATLKLNMLKMFGMVETKVGEWTDGKESRGMQVFKVTVSKEDRLNAIDEVIQFHQNQIDKLQLNKQQIESGN